MSSLFSNNFAIVIVCITILLLVFGALIVFNKFSNNVHISKDGIEIIKRDTSNNMRTVIQESLCDLDVRLDYLKVCMISRYPDSEYMIKYNVSKIKDCGERILFFNNVKDEEDYIQFRLSTINSLLDSFGKILEWPREEIEKQFREWIKNICYLKAKREV